MKRNQARDRKRSPHPSARILLAIAATAVAVPLPATAQDVPIPGTEERTHPLVLESSLDGGPWRPVPTTELKTLPDGRLWLPFQDRIISYRLRPGKAAPAVAGTPPPWPLSRSVITYSPEAGSFLTLTTSEDLKEWRALDSNQLSADQQGILFPLKAKSGFWDLKVRGQVPDPLPFEPLRIYPDPAATFQKVPFPGPGTSPGTGGGGIYLDPWEGAGERFPVPGEHAFNRYIFEERIHQLYEGDVKGYGLVIANEEGFQMKVSGGWARDPEDPNQGGVGMATFRPGNVGSTTKLFAGVALMQLLQEKNPSLDAILDTTVWPYLPPLWWGDLSDTHKLITFRMVLGHTSGISDIQVSGNAPANLENNPDYWHWSQPLQGTQGCYEYANENYRIITYLIAKLAEPNAMLAAHIGSSSKTFDEYLDDMDEAHGTAFHNYMRDVFFPQIANCAPTADPGNFYPAGTTALMYSSPNDSQGLQSSAFDALGFSRAQGGYWADAQEIARFLMKLRYTEDLLSTQNSDRLLSEQGGCNNPDRWLITNGRATHTGFENELGVTWWRSKQGRRPSSESPGGTGRANAMFMPYGWVSSYVVNSDTLSGQDNNDHFTAIVDAFWDATRDEPATISREAMNLTRFEETSTYLRDHHMAVKWLDLYDIGGVPYVNAVYGDSPQPVAGKVGMNAHSYQAFFDYWVKTKGFAVQQVESYLHHGMIRYAAIITEENRPEQRAYHGLDYDAHVAKANEFKDEGFVPVNVSVVSMNNKRWYTALYERRTVKFQMRTWLSALEYDQKFDDYMAQGYKVVSLNAYRHQGQRYYAAIWHKEAGGQRGIHEADRHAYRAADASSLNGQRVPTVITGVDSGSQNASTQMRHRFGAIWR